MLKRTMLAAALSAAACAPAPLAQTPREVWTELELVDAPDGLSGLARDQSGRLWAVSENDRSIASVDPRSGEVAVVKIAGVPEGVELESIAFLPNGDAAIGTESEVGGRSSDIVLLARRRPGSSELRVDGQMTVPYGLWGIGAAPNEGIEGMCAAGDSLVVVAEGVIESQGRRYAPMAVYSFSASTFRALFLQLTSREGKISGIACRASRGGIEFVAIERHYPVRRVVRGVIAANSQDTRITPHVELDFSSRTENFEGIAWLADGSYAIVDDNFMSGERFGPAKLLVTSTEM